MDHSPAYIIAQYLIGEALLTTPGSSGDWKVYVGMLPDGDGVDHDAVGCMDTSSVKDGRLARSRKTIFHEGAQLLLRSTDYNDGYAKLDALKEALELVNWVIVTISVSNYRLYNITLTTGVVVLGQDPKRRELFSLNFLITLKEL